MYSKEYFVYDLVTFEQHQLDDRRWQTDIAQPIRDIMQVSQLVLCLHMKVNKEVQSQDKQSSYPCSYPRCLV